MIAILSDIHGNLSALNAVLEEVKLKKIKKIICLGDICGYYYEFQEAISKLKKFDLICLLGNHEKMLLKSLVDKSYLSTVNQKYGFGCKKAIENLSDENDSFLKKLNESFVDDVRGLHFSHSNPENDDLHIYENSDPSIYERFCRFKERTFFIGHNHYQFCKVYKNNTIYSVGSVGQNRLKGGIANWAILHENNEVSMMATTYNVNLEINKVDSDDPKKDYLVKVLLR